MPLLLHSSNSLTKWCSRKTVRKKKSATCLIHCRTENSQNIPKGHQIFNRCKKGSGYNIIIILILEFLSRSVFVSLLMFMCLYNYSDDHHSLPNLLLHYWVMYNKIGVVGALIIMYTNQYESIKYTLAYLVSIQALWKYFYDLNLSCKSA